MALATPPEASAQAGQLVPRLLQFARLLRRAGLPVGSDRVLTTLQALQVAGLATRADFHTVLSACLLDRRAHQPLFDLAFERFWAAPGAGAGAGLPLAPPPAGPDAPATPAEPPTPPGARRLAEAWGAGPLPHPPPPELAPEPGPAQLAWTDRERLQRVDFDAMGADEWRQAQRLLARLRLVFEPLPTRRTRPAPRPGQPDWRATLAAQGRRGGEGWDLRWRQRRSRPARLLVLADISGSMRRYTRMLLHLTHALGQAGAPVESFVFGTRLTRTTRLLSGRDPDLAVAQVVQAVPDWSGGTRIAASLHAFNRRWAGRVLSGQTTVLLVTDGLERGDSQALAAEVARLRRCCRCLVWLNPLLRYDGFEPRAAGIRAMLPHVDRFLPVHNLHSLQQLVQLLAAGLDPGRRSAAGAPRGPSAPWLGRC